MSDSESDNENFGNEQCKVDLGFLEDCPSWKLESRFFPSKVGFKPAWLALSTDIPCSDSLTCATCNKTKMFLCQIYAPILDKEDCFHRTLYVFLCKTDGCIKSNSNFGFEVFRCQLGQVNKYYPCDPPVEEETWRSDLNALLFNVKLCGVCGIRSTNHCSKCKIVNYCSKEHQILDWKSGHKKLCGKSDNSIKNEMKYLFPEYEIVIEHENDIIYEQKESTQNDTNLTTKKGTLQDIHCEDELGKMALSDDDKHFKKFRERIKYAPDQVIRYDREGEPLWLTDNNISASNNNVPECQYCGSKRIFEFQILPQLLNYLELDGLQNSLDWGTLAIFTCKNSCSDGPDYKEEYLLKQDISDGVEESFQSFGGNEIVTE